MEYFLLLGVSLVVSYIHYDKSKAHETKSITACKAVNDRFTELKIRESEEGR